MNSLNRVLTALVFVALLPGLPSTATAAEPLVLGPTPLFMLPPETRVTLTRQVESVPFDLPESAPVVTAKPNNRPVECRTCSTTTDDRLPPFVL